MRVLWHSPKYTWLIQCSSVNKNSIVDGFIYKQTSHDFNFTISALRIFLRSITKSWITNDEGTERYHYTARGSTSLYQLRAARTCSSIRPLSSSNCSHDALIRELRATTRHGSPLVVLCEPWWCQHSLLFIYFFITRKMPNQRERIVACAAACYVLMSGDYLSKKKKNAKDGGGWIHSIKVGLRKFHIFIFWKHTNDLYSDTFYHRYNATDMLLDFIKEPSGKFQNFCRMSAADFEYLLNKISPQIAKIDTNMRNCIPVKERFAVALRFLATGDSYISLSFLFKFSVQTVSKCIDEVCSALIQELQEEIKVNNN